MIIPSTIGKWLTCAMIILFMVMGKSYAQTDSITYNSTCANFKIEFNSSVFDRIAFPSKVIWNFGDPASGFYNTSQTKFPTHSFASPGDYEINLTVVNAGDTTRVRDTIHVITPMAYNFGPDIFLCAKTDTTIQGPVVPGAVYEWNDDSLTAASSLHVTKTGVYTVRINGCPVSDSIGIFYSDSPRIKLGDDHILCAGEVLTLNASTQNGSYQWTLNGSPMIDTTGQLPVAAPGGQYAVKVTVPGCGIFSDTAVIGFSATPAIPFSLGPDTLLCPGASYPLNATLPGATAYAWSTGDQGAQITVRAQGEYWAFVKIGGDCEVVDTVEVTYRGDKNLDFHDTAICKGSTLILNADFGTGTYHWSSDPPQRDDQNQTNQSTYYVYEPGMYKVIAQVGDCVYTDSLRVSFNDSLYLDIGRDTSLCIGEEFVLHVKTNANSFLWQDGSTAFNYPINGAGVYTVIAENGCGQDTAIVNIDTRHCECDLTMPNAFSPNGDGHNETFRPLHPCNMTNYNLKIFNRYGEMVFQSSDPSVGWTGLFNKEPAASGTYVWIAGFTNANTQQRNLRKGFVVLVR